MSNRREFIKTAGSIGAGVLLGSSWQVVWAAPIRSLPSSFSRCAV